MQQEDLAHIIQSSSSTNASVAQKCLTTNSKQPEENMTCFHLNAADGKIQGTMEGNGI